MTRFIEREAVPGPIELEPVFSAIDIVHASLARTLGLPVTTGDVEVANLRQIDLTEKETAAYDREARQLIWGETMGLLEATPFNGVVVADNNDPYEFLDKPTHLGLKWSFMYPKFLDADGREMNVFINVVARSRQDDVSQPLKTLMGQFYGVKMDQTAMRGAVQAVGLQPGSWLKGRSGATRREQRQATGAAFLQEAQELDTYVYVQRVGSDKLRKILQGTFTREDMERCREEIKRDASEWLRPLPGVNEAIDTYLDSNRKWGRNYDEAGASRRFRVMYDINKWIDQCLRLNYTLNK